MDNWLPMDTAPKGVVILARSYNGRTMLIAHSFDDEWVTAMGQPYTMKQLHFDGWRPLDPMPVEVCKPPHRDIVATIGGKMRVVLTYETEVGEYLPFYMTREGWDYDAETLSDTGEDEQDIPEDLIGRITHWMLALTPVQI